MHRLTNVIIASERERQITYSTTDMCPRQVLFDPSGCFDEINSIIVVFLNTRCYRKYIGIEDNIIRIETYLRSQNTVSAFANFNFALISICLALLVESHHHNGCSKLLDYRGTFDELFLPFLQGNGVDNRLALQTLQASLNDFPLRRVNHNRYSCDVRIGHNEIQESLHLFLGIQQSIVHIYIDDQGTVFHLLAGNAQSFFVILLIDQAKKLTRTCHIASLTHVDETNLR